MFKLLTLESIVALLYAIQMPCLAQTAPSPSLGELIENAKLERAAKGIGTTTAEGNNLNRGLALKDPTKSALAPTEPLLWSLTGINQHLVAEVFYQGRVHVLHLFDNERTIGPWQVERYSTHGLLLTQANKGHPKPAAPSLFLSAPQPGGSTAKFAFLADNQLSSLQAAAQLPVQAPVQLPAPTIPIAPTTDAIQRPSNGAGF